MVTSITTASHNNGGTRCDREDVDVMRLGGLAALRCGAQVCAPLVLGSLVCCYGFGGNEDQAEGQASCP